MFWDLEDIWFDRSNDVRKNGMREEKTLGISREKRTKL